LRRRACDAALAAAAKNRKKSTTTEEEEGDEVEKPNVEVKIVDEGLGLFPPEPGAVEPGAKYLELPSIIDQQEYEEQRRKMLAEIAAEDAALPMETPDPPPPIDRVPPVIAVLPL
jgi:hypothetical protein